MKIVFRQIVEYFEHGDLVPLIVIVSAIHYTAILSGHDHFVAAVSIGALVDLGHYRWVKAAVRYTGSNRWEVAGRWMMVLIMSAIALNYQQRFYGDWWLSVPLPLLIASLAWLNQKDSRTHPRSKANTVSSELTKIRSELTASSLSEPLAEVEPNVSSLSETQSRLEPDIVYPCRKCEREFSSQSALNAHQRRHKDAP